jgi:hypothetical protein
MEASISGSRGFRFPVNRTWRRENVLVSLVEYNVVKELREKSHITHAYKQAAPKETTPRIFGIVIVGVQKDGPLIPTDQQFSTSQVLFGPVYKEARK